MEEKRNIRIYALIAGPYAFVGKTRGKKLMPIYWQHLRGENTYTCPFFMREANSNQKMYVLEQIYDTYTVAYQYQVAFIRILMDKGFRVVNSGGMRRDAKYLHESTRKLWQELKRVPFRKRLAQGLVSYPEREADSEKTNPMAIPQKDAEKADIKITVRGTRSEKELLDSFTERLQITQRQAFQLFMKFADPDAGKWNENEYLSENLKVVSEENRRLQKENALLQKKIRELIRKENAEVRERERFMREGITKFFQHFESECRHMDLLKREKLRTVNRSQLKEEGYRYPETAGFFRFFPEKILIGEGKFAPLFIVGKNRRGQNLCLRYYPKEYRVGFSFSNEKFGFEGTEWYVGVEKAKDGAMDLVFALPMDICRKGHRRRPDPMADDVQQLIWDAAHRSEEDELEDWLNDLFAED